MTEIGEKEIVYGLRLARAVRAKTLELLRGLSQDRFDRQPSQSGWLAGEKGQWSLGEHTDHILRVEAYIRSEIIEKLIEMSNTAAGNFQSRSTMFVVLTATTTVLRRPVTVFVPVSA